MFMKRAALFGDQLAAMGVVVCAETSSDSDADVEADSAADTAPGR